MAGQVERAIASHKQSGDYKGADSDEFLSGFMKGDQLMPVVTLTILFSPKVWDAPVSIHGMFGTQDAAVLSFVPDYKINLITPASMEDQDFGKLQTTLKEVLAFIKYSGDEVKLKEVLAKDEMFHHLGRNEIEVLNACVGAKLTMNKDEEVLDVCVAIQNLEEKARLKNLLDNINSLMKKMGWSAEQSMEMLDVSENDRKQLSKLLD